jgi:hypothetical protein
MQDETPCDVTHRQILEGLCPMCDRFIENGQITAKSNGPSQIRWNWVAVEECLRDGDSRIRSHTVWHLSSMAKSIDKALPLLALALTDSDPETRSQAEDACGRIGRDLSEEQVVWLEMQRDTADRALAARTVLLGKYFLGKKKAVRAARATHIYWIIEHHPDFKVAGSPDAALFKFQEPVAYKPAKELWLQQCEANQSNAAVLGNAARFFLLNEPEIAEKLFLQAQRIEPDNPQWHELLAQLHSLSARHGSEELRNRKAHQSLVELEMAEQIRSAHSGISSEEESQVTELLMRIHTLPNRARAAFEAGELTFARQFAEECLALATSGEIPEFFRNDGNAIHYGHLVLGQVALQEGELERAKAHLIESGRTTGSPNLGSFGPNMSLAKEMLERDERGIVLEYLDLCGTFWKMGSDQLAEWKDQIAQGKTPEFGANLHY